MSKSYRDRAVVFAKEKSEGRHAMAVLPKGRLHQNAKCALICMVRPPTVVALIVPAPCGLSGVERLTGSLKLPSGTSKLGWLKTLLASARNSMTAFSKRWKFFPSDKFAVSMPGPRSEFRRESPKVPFGAMAYWLGSYHSLMLL